MSVYEQARLLLLALNRAALFEPLALIFYLRLDSKLVHAELVRKTRGIDVHFNGAPYLCEYLRRHRQVFHLSVVGSEVDSLPRLEQSVLRVVRRAVYNSLKALCAVIFDYLVGILAALQMQNLYLHARGAEYSERAGRRLLTRLIRVVG